MWYSTELIEFDPIPPRTHSKSRTRGVRCGTVEFEEHEIDGSSAMHHLFLPSFSLSFLVGNLSPFESNFATYIVAEPEKLIVVLG